MLSPNHPFDDGRQAQRHSEKFIDTDQGRELARQVQEGTAQLLGALERRLADLAELNDPDVAPLIGECKKTIAEIRREIEALDRH